MELISIGLTTIFAVFVVVMARRLSGLTDDLQRARSQNYERYYELAERLETLKTEIRALRVQTRHLSSGTNQFQPEMSYSEAVALHPAAQSVLSSFHLGGCNSCAVDDDDTLADSAAQNNVPLAELMESLNKLLEGRIPAAATERGSSGLLQIEGL